MAVKFEEDDVGRLVLLELDKTKVDKELGAGKKGIFGKIVSVTADSVNVEIIPIPYEGSRPVKEIPYEAIKNTRYLHS